MSIFMHIDGIKGAASDKHHKDWIESQALNGAASASSAPPAATAKAAMPASTT